MFYQNPNYYGEWRELNSIFKKQDNHILINFVYDCPKEHLMYYSNLIIHEFEKRGYKIKSLDNYNTYFEGIQAPVYIAPANLFNGKMGERYLRLGRKAYIYTLNNGSTLTDCYKNKWVIENDEIVCYKLKTWLPFNGHSTKTPTETRIKITKDMEYTIDDNSIVSDNTIFCD